MAIGRHQGADRFRFLAHFPEDLRPMHQLCREGRLYDVERWIVDGKPLRLAPEAIGKGTRPKTAQDWSSDLERTLNRSGTFHGGSAARHRAEPGSVSRRQGSHTPVNVASTSAAR